jgi:hypothetical protein
VLAAALAEWADQDVLAAEIVGLAPGRTLADLREDPSAPRLVVNGQLDAPMLRLDDELGRVWFEDLELEIVGEGAMAIEPGVGSDGYTVGERFPGERPLMLSPTAVVRIRATLPRRIRSSRTRTACSATRSGATRLEATPRMSKTSGALVPVMSAAQRRLD